MKKTNYVLYIGGTDRARAEWRSGTVYKHRSSARRRSRQIIAAGDLGVGSVWIVTNS